MVCIARRDDGVANFFPSYSLLTGDAALRGAGRDGGARATVGGGKLCVRRLAAKKRGGMGR